MTNQNGKQDLKRVLVEALQICRELNDEYHVSFSTSEILKLGVTLFISQTRNGNGAANNGNGNDKNKDTAIVNFGKYKGMDLLEILRTDRSYISWLAANCMNRKLRELSKSILEEDGLSTDSLSGTVAAA